MKLLKELGVKNTGQPHKYYNKWSSSIAGFTNKAFRRHAWVLTHTSTCLLPGLTCSGEQEEELKLDMT